MCQHTHTTKLLTCCTIRSSNIYIATTNLYDDDDDDDDDDIKFISIKIGSCRPLRSCGKIIIIK